MCNEVGECTLACRSQQLEAMSAVRSKRLQDRQSKMNEVYLEVERLKARNAELKERKRVFLADDDLEFKARYAAMEARLHAIKVVPMGS